MIAKRGDALPSQREAAGKDDHSGEGNSGNCFNKYHVVASRFEEMGRRVLRLRREISQATARGEERERDPSPAKQVRSQRGHHRKARHLPRQ